MATDDELIEAYLTLRDGVQAIAKQQEDQLRPYKVKMAEIEAEMATRLLERGATNSKTENGTAYVSRTTSVRAADKGIFVEYVRANQAFDLMEVRPAKEGVEAYMQTHEGLPPPGIDVATHQKVNFRRS